MTESQDLEIMGIFVKGEACVTCPHFKSEHNWDKFLGWTSCDVLNGNAPYEECRGIKNKGIKMEDIFCNIERDLEAPRRRERIAAALAAGMYANPSIEWKHIPHDAVQEADALIAELEKEKK